MAYLHVDTVQFTFYLNQQIQSSVQLLYDNKNPFLALKTLKTITKLQVPVKTSLAVYLLNQTYFLLY